MNGLPTEKELQAIEEYIKLQDVGAFEIMKKYYIEPNRFWKAYKYVMKDKR